MSEDELHPHLPLFHAPPIPSQPTFSPRSLGILESGCSSRSTIIITSSSPRPHLVLTHQPRPRTQRSFCTPAFRPALLSLAIASPSASPSASSQPPPSLLPASSLAASSPQGTPRFQTNLFLKPSSFLDLRLSRSSRQHKDGCRDKRRLRAKGRMDATTRERMDATSAPRREKETRTTPVNKHVRARKRT